MEQLETSMTAGDTRLVRGRFVAKRYLRPETRVSCDRAGERGGLLCSGSKVYEPK